MKQITLTKGKVALVDDGDYDWLNQHKWHCSAYGYAQRRISYPDEMLWMHREIMRTPKNMITDHINRNPLDNRRANLRICTKQLNAANSKMRQDNSSGYRGVTWSKSRQKWIAQIFIKDKSFNLGGYVNIEEAAKVYNKAATELFGEFASLNEAL